MKTGLTARAARRAYTTCSIASGIWGILFLINGSWWRLTGASLSLALTVYYVVQHVRLARAEDRP